MLVSIREIERLRAELATVTAKVTAERDALLHALVCRNDPLHGAAYQDLASRTIESVRRAIAENKKAGDAS